MTLSKFLASYYWATGDIERFRIAYGDDLIVDANEIISKMHNLDACFSNILH